MLLARAWQHDSVGKACSGHLEPHSEQVSVRELVEGHAEILAWAGTYTPHQRATKDGCLSDIAVNAPWPSQQSNPPTTGTDHDHASQHSRIWITLHLTPYKVSHLSYQR